MSSYLSWRQVKTDRRSGSYDRADAAMRVWMMVMPYDLIGRMARPRSQVVFFFSLLSWLGVFFSLDFLLSCVLLPLSSSVRTLSHCHPECPVALMSFALFLIPPAAGWHEKKNDIAVVEDPRAGVQKKKNSALRPRALV